MENITQEKKIFNWLCRKLEEKKIRRVLAIGLLHYGIIVNTVELKGQVVRLAVLIEP